MGLLDDITGKAGSMLGGLGGGDTKLIGSAIEVIQEKFGGIDGLVEAFKRNGLGGVISSWVSSDKQNEPIDKQQVEKGLGKDNVEEIARRAGTSEDDAAGKLSGYLPKIIDLLTPDGKGGGNILEKGKKILGL